MKTKLPAILALFGVMKMSALAQGICGTDDRVASSHAAIARIRIIGFRPCTAFLIADGKLVTAGHCFDSQGQYIVEFNVPLSDPDGTMNDALPEDQYEVDPNSISKGSGLDGDDWAVFEVFSNELTQMTPLEAQGEYLALAQEDLSQTDAVRVTGYGLDPSTVYNHAQQTATGPYLGISGNVIQFLADIDHGSSGGPIIYEARDLVVGVTTDGNCQGSYNWGTSTHNSTFWSALGIQAIVLDQQNESGQQLVDTEIGRWRDSEFMSIPIVSPLPIINGIPGEYEVLRADQHLVDERKYNLWSGFPDIINHKEFLVDAGLTGLLSSFKPVYGAVTIKTDLVDLPGTTGGYIGFKDPWYIDYDDPVYGNNRRNRGADLAVLYARPVGADGFKPDFTTEYPEGTYLGVFLEQDPAQTPNFYSVEAPEPNDISGFTSYFLNWTLSGAALEDNSLAFEQPVVFAATDAVVTAVYKAHLYSSITTATSTNSQRKVVRLSDVGALDGGADTDIHLVYESAGEIWYSRASNYSGPWDPEVRVSDGTGNFGNPSIALGYDGDLYIVYRKANGATPSIYFRDRLAGVWGDQTLLGTGSGEAWPVIGRTNAGTGPYDIIVLRVVWEENEGLKGKGAYWNEGPPEPHWTWDISETSIEGPGYADPSIASTYIKPDGTQEPYLSMTYDYGSDIYFKPLRNYFYDEDESAPASVIPNSYKAQIGADTRNPSGLLP